MICTQVNNDVAILLGASGKRVSKET
ncbi:hypothetical protein BRAS3843_940015 [Bradyrhizobium sp. STM 3843]|nr:hypothetical protein BRAS3843_940015 [Bradyrhizobium sp. STM 3843]